MTLAEIKEALPFVQSDDHATAVQELNKRAAKVAVGERTKEIYTSLDNDLLEITKRTKPDGSKTYEHLRTVLAEGHKAYAEAKELRNKYAELKGRYNALAEKADKGNAGGERAAQLEKDLAKATDRIKALEGEMTSKAEAWETKFNEQATEHEAQRFRATMDQAKAGLKFREGTTEYLQSLALSDAVDKINAMGRQWTDDGRLEFLNEDGMVQRDKETSKPLTATELLKARLTEADLLATTETRAGAGSKPTLAAASGGSAFSIAGAPDKATATRMAEDHLIAQGYELGTEKFQEQYDKIFTEHIQNADLPMRAPVAA